MLDVYYQDRLVGQVRQNSNSPPSLEFRYAEQWREDDDAFAISVGMPLGHDAFESQFVTPWFANLLPEEQQLATIGRLLGHAQGDVYSLLEEIGRDTAGALCIGQPQPRDAGDYRALSDKQLAAAIDRLPQRPLLAGEEGVHMSLAGAQAKLAVAIFDGKIHLPLNGAASTHILKPQHARFHDTVENELLCLRLAQAVGLPVASAAMRAIGGQKLLLVERYDRRIDAERNVTRGHQEDFCQALGIYPTAKYQSGGGPGLPSLFGVLDRHSRAPAPDRLTLLDQVIFTCCIGDTDRHGKNFSLLLGLDGPRLAPAYDFMSALTYDGVTRNMAMKIDDRSRAEHVERRHWERFARAVGLAPAATVNRVEQLARAVAGDVRGVADGLAREFALANRGALELFAAKIAKRAEQVARKSRKDTAGATAKN